VCSKADMTFPFTEGNVSNHVSARERKEIFFAMLGIAEPFQSTHPARSANRCRPRIFVCLDLFQSTHPARSATVPTFSPYLARSLRPKSANLEFSLIKMRQKCNDKRTNLYTARGANLPGISWDLRVRTFDQLLSTHSFAASSCAHLLKPLHIR